jgi:hypothetical protein
MSAQKDSEKKDDRSFEGFNWGAIVDKWHEENNHCVSVDEVKEDADYHLRSSEFYSSPFAYIDTMCTEDEHLRDGFLISLLSYVAEAYVTENPKAAAKDLRALYVRRDENNNIVQKVVPHLKHACAEHKERLDQYEWYGVCALVGIAIGCISWMTHTLNNKK